MKIVKKNSIDFSKYTDNQLESSLINIDREKFPQNYEACLAEIDKRKVAGHFIAKEDKLSSSRAGAYLIQIYIFCFIGLFLAICTIFLLINQHSISTIAGFLLVLTVLWNFISYFILFRFSYRCREVFATKNGLRLISLNNQNTENIEYNEIIKIGSRSFFGLYGNRAILVTTDKRFSFGNFFYFIAKTNFLKDSVLSKNQDHPEIIKFFDLVLKNNPNVIKDDGTEFLP